ncbi:S-layer homology domain-containing protein [Deinococcus fonticola]|uniref:S-layer homology domain-containing protein n=1 Tax=Deinococcus fonticola TaxID=2528713 RepID=UPI0030B854F9
MLVLTAALMFGGLASAQTSATASAPQVPALTDVPAGHWAKDAIDRLVSRGILLGYPDGTFRGTQNLTRYEAAVIIARLLEQMAAGTAPVVAGDDLVALQNAVQELAADLAALGVRVSDLEENAVSKDDFSRLEARVEELAGNQGDAEAVAALQAQIDDLTARADEYDTLRADVDDNASSIAALNDLTVLLNQDILDLQDRVSAVEAAQADFVTRADFDNLSGKVTAIDTRVGVLEKLPRFSVSGSIDAAYGNIALIKGTNHFDITRLTTGTFAAGVFDVADGADVTVEDTPQAYTGTGVRFGVKASQLATTNGAIVINNAAINFRTQNAWNIAAGDPVVFVNDANADGTIGGQKFTVMYHRTAADFKFQDYLFNNMDSSGRRGIVATIDTNLPGAPKLTILAGNTNDKEMLAAGVASANYWGVKAEQKVGADGKFGVSYAHVDNTRTAFGTYADLKFGVLAVKGEGVVSARSNAALVTNFTKNVTTSLAEADKAAYVEARADLGIVKFGANYRAISPAFGDDGTEANAAMSSSYSYPYKADQVGFGAALGTNLGPVALGAYADRFTNWVGANPTLGFGVKAGAKFGALEAVAFYNSLNRNGDMVDGIAAKIDNGWMGSDYNKNANSVGMGIANVPFAMTSTFGAQISHDGAATNALVKNLNFTVGDAFYNVSKTNSVYAYGDYTASFGGFTIKPLLRFHMASNGAAAYSADAYNFTTFKYGVKLSSGVLTGVPLQPSLYANVAGRNTTGKFTNTTTNELLAQAGVGFNSFLISGVTANVGYSYYTGKNVAPIYVGAADKAFNSADDRVYHNAGVNNVTVNGLTAQVGWNGLTANYGLFKNYVYNSAGTQTDESIAQGFKVAYNFKF